MVFRQNLKKFEISLAAIDMQVYICIINSFASMERSEVKEVDIWKLNMWVHVLIHIEQQKKSSKLRFIGNDELGN